jgi:hypothetical protein
MFISSASIYMHICMRAEPRAKERDSLAMDIAVLKLPRTCSPAGLTGWNSWQLRVFAEEIGWECGNQVLGTRNLRLACGRSGEIGCIVEYWDRAVQREPARLHISCLTSRTIKCSIDHTNTPPNHVGIEHVVPIPSIRREYAAKAGTIPLPRLACTCAS